MNEFVPTPPPEVRIDSALVTTLLQEQHPDLADLALGDRHEGWDNVTWRLGDDLAVRMPRRAIASTLVATELAWLPRVGRDWPFRAPLAVRIGDPSDRYPWHWSVVPWIDGHLAFDEPLSALGAHDLGLALAALHQPAPADAPINPFRSSPLSERLDRARARIDALASQQATHPAPNGAVLDVDAAEALIRRGVRGTRPERVCAHLDLHGENVITASGRLSGIIDWGDAGAGDRATDLGQAYVLLGPTLWRVMLEAYGGVNRATRERAKAEAVAYAVTLATMTDGPYAACGWDALVSLGVAVPAA
ncbi:phosphotransferase [Demequina oxidasica]|uniref:phosphotransferase n=1 Tax=Demequina oxidasica TaxID=676199 RepID=UPI000785B86F|nr:phosphotransferase [Demequina oxidasica]